MVYVSRARGRAAAVSGDAAAGIQRVARRRYRPRGMEDRNVRIHSDRITPADLFTAASIAGVRVDDWSIHGSKTRAAAIKFYVFGSSSHRPNQRDYGPDDYAATWDEWGILLGHLFSVDPNAHTGRYGY